jgi:hypothetical protein
MKKYMAVRGTQAELDNMMAIFGVEDDHVESTEMFADGTIEAVIHIEGEISEIEQIIEIVG